MLRRTQPCLLWTIVLAVLFFAAPADPTNRRLETSRRKKNRLRRTLEEPPTAEPTSPPVEEPTWQPVEGSEEPTGPPNGETTGPSVEGSEEPTEAPAADLPEKFSAHMVILATLTMADDDTGVCAATAIGRVKDMPHLKATLGALDIDSDAAADVKVLDDEDLPSNAEAVTVSLSGASVVDKIATGVDVGAGAYEVVPDGKERDFNSHDVSLLLPKAEVLTLTVVTNPLLFAGDWIGVYAQNPSDVAASVDLEASSDVLEPADDDFDRFQTLLLGKKTTRWWVVRLTNFNAELDKFVIRAKIGLSGEEAGSERVSNQITVKVGPTI